MSTNYADYFHSWEEKVGAFIEYRDDFAEKALNNKAAGSSSSPVAGLPFAVKDNIAVEGFSLSCGSKLLEGLRSPYTASAVKRLEAAGAFTAGKTNMDEFGMGSSTDFSALKRTNNPWDALCVAGGSSGGSAAAVSAGLVPFALGSDTGGSVRQPAAFCGVVGLKPTWGAVSRFGLVAYSSSLETIGVLSDTVERCRSVFNIIKGLDPLDETTREGADENKSETRTIGVLSRESLAGMSEDTRRGFEKAKKTLLSLGYNLKDVEFDALRFAVPAYYTIAAAEASANLARFDGVRYGRRPDWSENHEELVEKARTCGFGGEVKLRVLLGTFVLRSGFQDKYYSRAQRIRAMLRKDFERELSPDRCGAILMPVFPTTAFGRGEAGLSPFAQKTSDIWTCCANLAGLPALSFPASIEGGLPVGVQILGRPFGENELLDIAARFEAARPFAHPDGYFNFWSE